MRPRRRWLGAALVLLVALLLQLSLMPDLRIFGAMGDMLLLVTVAAALVDGPERGATTGFAAGLLYDLVLSTPFGLSALVYTLVGFGVGWVGTFLPRAPLWSPFVVAAAAGVAATVLYVIVGNLVGSPFPFGNLPRVAFAVAAWNVLLIVPARALFRRLSGRAEPDRIHLALGR